MHDGFSNDPFDSSDDEVEHVTQRENNRQASRQQEACNLMEQLRDILAENDYRDCEDHTWYKRIWKLPLYRKVTAEAFRLRNSVFLVTYKQEVFIAEREADGFGNTYLIRKPADEASDYVDILRSAYWRLLQS